MSLFKSQRLAQRLLEMEEAYALERRRRFPIRVVWVEEPSLPPGWHDICTAGALPQSGEGEEADGESGQGVSGVVIAAINGRDGDKERVSDNDPAVAPAVRHRNEESPGAGEGRGDVGAGKYAGMDAVLAEDCEVEAAEDGDDVR
jgi:hypothetical protein